MEMVEVCRQEFRREAYGEKASQHNHNQAILQQELLSCKKSQSPGLIINVYVTTSGGLVHLDGFWQNAASNQVNTSEKWHKIWFHCTSFRLLLLKVEPPKGQSGTWKATPVVPKKELWWGCPSQAYHFWANQSVIYYYFAHIFYISNSF